MTSPFPAGLIDDLAREREVVEPNQILDVTIFIWTLIYLYNLFYNIATGHELWPSSFYDRFTDGIADLLGDLLEHVIEPAAVPNVPGTGGRSGST